LVVGDRSAFTDGSVKLIGIGEASTCGLTALIGDYRVRRIIDAHASDQPSWATVFPVMPAGDVALGAALVGFERDRSGSVPAEFSGQPAGVGKRFAMDVAQGEPRPGRVVRRGSFWWVAGQRDWCVEQVRGGPAASIPGLEFEGDLWSVLGTEVSACVPGGVGPVPTQRCRRWPGVDSTDFRLIGR